MEHMTALFLAVAIGASLTSISDAITSKKPPVWEVLIASLFWYLSFYTLLHYHR